MTRTAWFPLYLLGLATLTLSPFWIHCTPRDLDWHLDAGDAAANLALLSPLGLVLRRHGAAWWVALLFAFTCSGAIETGQRWLSRDPDLVDLVTNTSGAYIGWWIAPRLHLTLRWVTLPRLRLATIALALGTAIATGFMAKQIQDPGLLGWRPYPLWLANEADGQRPWQGRIERVQIYDRFLTRDERSDSSDAFFTLDLGSPARIRLARDTTRGVARWKPLSISPSEDLVLRADGLVATGGQFRLERPADLAQIAHDRITAAQAFTLRIRLEATSKSHPAFSSIVAMSSSALERNFTLGQRGADLELRLRVAGNGQSGHERIIVSTRTAPIDSNAHEIQVAVNQGVAEIRVDGRCAGDALLSLARAPELLSESIGAYLLGLFVISGATGALVFSARPRVAIVLSIAVAYAALRAMGLWSHLPHIEIPAIALAILSALALMPLVVSSIGSDRIGQDPDHPFEQPRVGHHPDGKG